MLLVSMSVLALVCAVGDVSAYTSIRVPVGPTGQGVPVRWDLNNVAARPNIANRRVLYEIGDAGCADAKNFQGPINEFEAIQNSFARWRNINESDIGFEFAAATTNAVTDANDNRNVIRWVSSNITTGVFAVTITTFDTTTAQIVDADMELNDRDFTWDTLGPTATQGIIGRAMIENVVTHEIGHFIGLDHSQVAASALYFASSPGLIDQTVVRPDDRAVVIRDYTSTITDPTLGLVQGMITASSNPAFGVEIVLINIATGRVVVGAISEGPAGPFAPGSFQIANVPPGNYMALAIPIDKARVGSYYSSAFTAFYPVLRGITAGNVGAPTLVAVGSGQTVTGVNIALPGASQNPFESDGNAGSATVIANAEAAVSSISPGSDEDWYEFTTTQPGQTATIRVIADGFGSTLNPTLTLYSTNGTTVLVSPISSDPEFSAAANDLDSNAFDLSGANFDAEIVRTLATPGTYFFKVASRVGATQGRYVVTLEVSGESTTADPVASGIESSAPGVAAGGAGTFTLSVTPRNLFGRDLNAPSTFTVDLLDVTGASPAVIQTVTGSTPFDFILPALGTAQRKRYGARIDSVQIAQTVEVVHYGALSLSNSRIVVLESTLNANTYDRIPVRIELRDGANNLHPNPGVPVTLDTSRGSLDNGTTTGQTNVAAVFDAARGWWMIDMVAGGGTGATTLTARANGQQIDTASITILPRANGTGGGPPNGGSDNGDGDDDDGGCSAGYARWPWVLLLLVGVLTRKLRVARNL